MLQDFLQDVDFLLNTFGIYPEFQNDLETRQTWVSFRLDGDNQTCEVRMVLPRKEVLRHIQPGIC